jgi:hypothetical protein
MMLPGDRLTDGTLGASGGVVRWPDEMGSDAMNFLEDLAGGVERELANDGITVP